MEYIRPHESMGYRKVRAARDIAGAITRLGPAILSFAVTGSFLALAWGSMVYVLGQQGQRELDRINQDFSVNITSSIDALSRSMDRELEVSLDRYMDEMLKELADKYREQSVSGTATHTIDIDALLRGQ